MSMVFDLLRVAAVLLATTQSCVFAAPSRPTCPDQLDTSAIRVTVSAPWVSFVELPLALHSASMASGPPEALSQLRGVSLERKGEPSSTQYEFGTIGDEGGKWLNCSYGGKGEVSISRRLDDSVKECTITHTARSPRERERVIIACK